MAKQITLEQALELVSFEQDEEGHWRVLDVNVNGFVYSNLRSCVGGKLHGSVIGGVLHGDVYVDGKSRIIEKEVEEPPRYLDGLAELSQRKSPWSDES